MAEVDAVSGRKRDAFGTRKVRKSIAANCVKCEVKQARCDEASRYENNANDFIDRHHCSNSQELQHPGQPDEYRVARHSSHLTHDMQHTNTSHASRDNAVRRVADLKGGDVVLHVE